MLIRNVIEEFLKDHSDVYIPIRDVAMECGCTPAYVARVVKKMNECETETRKFGKRYVRYKND